MTITNFDLVVLFCRAVREGCSPWVLQRLARLCQNASTNEELADHFSDVAEILRPGAAAGSKRLKGDDLLAIRQYLSLMSHMTVEEAHWR